MSHLELAVQGHIQGLLDELAGTEHTAQVYAITEDGLVILVKRRGSKAWSKESLFTLTWRQSLQIFTSVRPSGTLQGLVDERKK